MRNISNVFTKALSSVLFFSFVFASAALSQEQLYPEYDFPVIKPAFSLSGGYRFIDKSGSERAGEYEYLHNSISLGGTSRLFLYPHRFHGDLYLKNRKDYFGEVMYAYKDILYFRGINRTLFHNLDSLRLSDLDTSTLSPGVDVRDSDSKYGIRSGNTALLMMVHTPDYPAHIYIAVNLYEKAGDQQQRTLLGSGFYNNLVRTSQGRDVDMQTTKIIVGANSHLGPVEIEISREEKRLDVNGDRVLHDSYGEAGSPPGSVRIEGVFPHNLISETKGSTNTIKVHTSSTGRLVAAATFSGTTIENMDSKAKAEYMQAFGSVVWVPMPKLTFIFKYRYKKKDIEDAGAIAMPNVCNASNNSGSDYTCIIKPSISSITDSFSGIVRYKPVRNLMLMTEYTYEEIDRKNAVQWALPRTTKKDNISLSADMRILKNLNLKAKYIHRDIENPAYNTEPDRLDEARFSVSWVPDKRVYTLLSYSISDEKRDDLHFNNNVGAKDRDVRRNRLLGSITSSLSEKLSITASYSYLNNKTKQDILYRSDVSPFSTKTDSAVPYQDDANIYTANLRYAPKENLSLETGITHSLIRGVFHPSMQDLLEPVSVASFSELKTKETVYSAGLEYGFRTGFITKLKYRYTDLNEISDNPYDDIEDGKTHVILLTISKRW